MDHRQRTGLDNQAIQGRVRTTRPAFVYDRPHAQKQTHTSNVDGFRIPHPKPRPDPQPIVQHVAPVQMPARAPVHTAHHVKPVVAHEHSDRPDLPRQSRSNVLHRQVVGKKIPKQLRPKKYRRPVLPTLITAMAVMLFSFGAFTAIQGLRANRQVKAQVQGLSTASDDGMSDGLPSEDDAPDDISGYKVAPDLPRFFNIDSLGVHARVRRLGVGKNNIMKSPANIFDVGWYDGSAKPGENGTAVINGHVSGPTKRGVFYSISTLKTGDKVSIERGDGKVINYTVTGTQVYDNDKVDMAKAMTSSVPGKPAMNFITCTGRFNVRTNQYEQRVVVFTVQD